MGYRRTLTVEFDGGKVARHLRRAGARIELGMGTVTRAVTSRTVAATTQAGNRLGGVHHHVLPGINIYGGNNVRLDTRNQPAVLGAVFGGGRRPTTRQFPPWRGSHRDAGYMLFPELREQERFLDVTVVELIDKAL